MSSLDFICYNWMPTVADHCMDLSEDFYASAGVSRLHNSTTINPERIQEDEVVFVKTDFIHNEEFQKTILPKIKNRFTLVTGISSYEVQGKESDILENDNVKHWFCTNPPDVNSDKIIPLPIGFEEKERDGGNQEILNSQRDNSPPWEDKLDKLYLPYHTIGTNPRRDSQVAFLASLSFVEIETDRLSFSDYLEKMGQYKYILCLSGAGHDTHRNYEALLVGSTPVMLNSPLKRVFDYYNLPSVFLKNWDELDNIYNNFLIKNDYYWDVTDFLDINTHKERILNYAKS